MKLTPCFLDFETFWSATHSLTKMDPISYVMHPDTEIQSVAAKLGNKPTVVRFGEGNIQTVCNNTDWSNKWVIGHNMSGFDALILAWRLGVRPAMWGCTLAMSRPFFSKTCGNSLKAVAAELGLGEKGSLELVNTKGKRLADFTPDELRKMEVYNKLDTDLCAGVFKQLAPRLGINEMKLIDMTIRMWVEPQFELDVKLLRDALSVVQTEKRTMLLTIAGLFGLQGEDDERIELARAMLASQPKFKQFLESRGVECPLKFNKPTGNTPPKLIPALGKNDEGFKALLEHEDLVVVSAAEARLGVKSTLLETRIGKFLDAAAVCDGKLPVPLAYAGADTTSRWSGLLYNMQNLPRSNNALRCVVGDTSIVELVNHL